MNYPFTAIVGQEKLKKALLLCAINPAIGGILIQGDKGTAKSTAARALAEVVPPIVKVTHCLFNCAVDKPLAICEVCSSSQDTVRQVNVPFINLPLGATEERVLGSLDLEAVLVEKKKKFQPGLLAAVHLGILYIDEVNLLSDHLVDILLDVSAMGENRIEREGLSLSHPSRFTLIGTMNPEEGQLRAQFLDRFGLMVHVEAPADIAERTEVVRRRIAFENDPAAFAQRWELTQERLQQQLIKAKQLLPSVQLNDDLLTLISELATTFNVRSLRADIVMYKTAITIAALGLRTEVNEQDIREAAELALSHRSRNKSFSTPQTPPAPPSSKPQEPKDPASNPAKNNDPLNNEARHPLTNEKPDQAGSKEKDQHLNSEKDQDLDVEKEPETGPQETASAHIFEANIPSALPEIQNLVNRNVQQARDGKRSIAANGTKGAYIRSEPANHTTDIAIEATVIHALTRDPDQFDITIDDLHQKKRNGKTGNLVLFVVDASGSMAARKRMEAVKGTVIKLLTDAYEKRDTVGVIAFRGIDAQILLHPTQSIELAEEAMHTLPTGGRTPLPHALQTSLQLLNAVSYKGYHPILVILTDGKANVPLPGSGDDAWSQTMRLAGQLKDLNIQSLVLNNESDYFNLDKAEELASLLGAQYISLDEISEEQLIPIINQVSYKSR